MKLEFLAQDKLVPSRANMRFAKKAPDVTDILPTVRKRGVIQPLIVRPNCAPANDDDGGFEIVAGFRRWTANGVVLGEGIDHGPLPCAILEDGDDADAIEASMIENMARLDPDEVTQWESFVRLVKEGRKPDDIAATFGLPDLTVKRILALGNLLPRIRDLYRAEKIDAATVRHLTMATKPQQKSWLALYEDTDPNVYCPTGHQLKAWLFGGAAISTKVALFDVETFTGSIVGDLFAEDRFFADPDAFWTAQNAAIEARRADYLDAGWSDAVIVGPKDEFRYWEHERAGKRKGGRVYIQVSARGDVSIHEGYVTRAEARRIERGDTAPLAKPARPEVTSTMQTYLDLHRHAAVRATLTGFPQIALRLMVAHAIAGSPLWGVEVEAQTTRNEDVRESVETSAAEAAFDEQRRAVLAVLGFDPDAPTVTRGNGDEYGLVGVFRRLLELPDAVVLEVVAIVMGETLFAGSAAVEAAGIEIGVDMATWWRADPVFFELLRDKEVLTRIVAEVAGETVAAANAGEKTKTMKKVVADHLAGENGRAKVEAWVPKWMAFPPSAYTTRGGVGTVKAAALAEASRAPDIDPEPATPAPVAALPAPDNDESQASLAA